MKKIGIITLNGYKNYGNRLQNYALQEAIKSFGFKVDTIIINSNNSATVPKKNLNFLNIKRIETKLLGIKNKKHTDIRTSRFKDFSAKYINETNYKISDDYLPNDQLLEYSKFVVGSDQVWNPFYINASPLYFLDFAPKAKRVSYAASFGISSIPNEYKKSYKDSLNKMEYLSVREEQGANIIREMTGRDVQVLIDPTMLLSKENWRAIAKKSKIKPDSPYLLTYFLGDVSREMYMKIKKIANDRNLEIVNLATLKDSQYFSVDPSEFIDFIDSATVFCTDSFHGVVFSILLESPFIAFERQGKQPSMNSRMETLLNKFNFTSRLAKNTFDNDEIYDIDYSHVKNILRIEQEKAFSYLKEALK